LVTKESVKDPQIIKNWESFGQYVDESKARIEAARASDALKRDETGERVGMVLIGAYDFGGTTKLADLVGQSNLGIKYVPQFISEESARKWIQKQESRAKTNKDKEIWRRWG
jgi:hypothetical protein